MLTEAAFYSLRTIARNHGFHDVLDALADIAKENALDFADAKLDQPAASFTRAEKGLRDLAERLSV